MFKSIFVLSAGLMLAASVSATDVGVSVQISQPGVYGRVDIGRFPQPAVVVTQPVVVAAPPPRMVVAQPVQPVYMWVPQAHRKDWRRHCRGYGACGVPVYFVRHDWYDHHVRGGDDRRGGRDRDDDRGRGHGRGHGKGRG